MQTEAGSPPAALYEKGDNRNLDFDQTDGIPYLIWQNKTASFWNVFYCDISESRQVDSLDFSPASNKTEPSILFISYVTKPGMSSNAPESSVLTFVVDSTYAQDEIFAGEFDFENISNNQQKDRHPQLFEKRGVGQQYEVLNIWESYVNDHWQLLMSEKDYDVGAIRRKAEIPATVQLYQNFPNPFNPATVISYRVSAVSRIELSIYNVLGQKIRTLEKDEKLPGKYKVYWSGLDDEENSLPSGSYFYQLIADGVLQSKRMIYLK